MIRAADKTREEKGDIHGVRYMVRESTDRKRAEKSLRESEARYRFLVESSGASIFWVNHDGVFLFMNSTAAAMLGGEPEDFVGLTMWDLFPADIADFQMGDIRTVIETGAGLTREAASVVRGEPAWFDVSLQPVAGTGGSVSSAQVIAIDITARKHMEVALRESEEWFRNIYDESPIGKEIYGSEGQLLDANKACLDIFGVSDVAEIRGFELFDDPNLSETDKEMLREGKTVRVEIPFDFEKIKDLKLYETTKSGIAYLDVLMTPLRLSGAAAAGGYLVQVQDITERVRAEEALRIQRDLGLALSRTSRVEEAAALCVEAAIRVPGMDCGGLHLVDKSSKDLNLVFSKGISPEFVARVSHYAVSSPGACLVMDAKPVYGQTESLDRAMYLAREWEGLRGIAIIPLLHEGEVIACLSVGSHKVYEWPLAARNALESVAAQIGGALVRLLAEQALREKEEQLRQAQKTEALGRLASGIAHDFDNILANILGYASLIRSRLPLGSQLANEMDIIVRSCHWGSDLTSELLTFARGGVTQRVAVNLNAVVQEAAELLWERIDPDIEVELRLADDLATITGDPSQLSRVVFNLGLNACDAMMSPSDGEAHSSRRLTLATSMVSLGEPVAEEMGLPAGHYVCLQVSDTGKGMDEETLKHIFDPFFTTKNASQARPHSGLGLPTVYGAVQAHGGAVKAVSAPGRGATFTIYLPAEEC